MSYVSYSTVRAFLSNGDEQTTNTGVCNVLYASNFNASNATQLKRVKRIGQELDYYIQTGPKSASISTTVLPVTGAGVNQFTGFLALTGDFTSGSFIHVPSYRFEKCFLKSMSFSLEPWKPMFLEMQFDSYGLATGSGIYVYDEYENLNFSIEIDRAPNFEIGSTYPTKVSVSKITKSLQINGVSNIDWLSDYQPNTTVSGSITMPDGNSFYMSGVLNSQTISIDSNGVAKGGLQIIEEMV